MNELANQFAIDPLGRLLLHYLSAGGIWHVHLFLLVASRLAGLILISPSLFSMSASWPLRIGLVALLALIIVPIVGNIAPPESAIVQAGDSTWSSTRIPETPVQLMTSMLAEAGLGTLLGVGIISLFSGLKLAAEWIDRHSGLGINSVFDAEASISGSAVRSLISYLGVACLFLVEPLGSDWHLFRVFINSFRTLPVGSMAWTLSAGEFLNVAVQQSLFLGIRVAMPLVATMMLVDVAISIAGRGATVAEATAILSIRAGVGLIVLGLTATTVPEAVYQAMLSSIRMITEIGS